MGDNYIQVEVAYATPEQQLVIPVKLKPGATAFDAAVQSGIGSRVPELNLETATMGVFGKVERNPKERVLLEGERVEIYRPLIADPKEIRKKRAANKTDAGAPGDSASK